MTHFRLLLQYLWSWHQCRCPCLRSCGHSLKKLKVIKKLNTKMETMKNLNREETVIKKLNTKMETMKNLNREGLSVTLDLSIHNKQHKDNVRNTHERPSFFEITCRHPHMSLPVRSTVEMTNSPRWLFQVSFLFGEHEFEPRFRSIKWEVWSFFSRNPVYPRRVDPSVLTFSLSSHRYSHVGLLFTSRFFV
jgi:hypothetical protein